MNDRKDSWRKSNRRTLVACWLSTPNRQDCLSGSMGKAIIRFIILCNTTMLDSTCLRARCCLGLHRESSTRYNANAVERYAVMIVPDVKNAVVDVVRRGSR